MEKRKFGFSLLLFILYFLGMFLLYKTRNVPYQKIINEQVVQINKNKIQTEKEIKQEEEISISNKIDTSIGTLEIPKIRLVKPLYSLESSLNNVDKNVTILKGSTYPNVENSHLYLAAHSGTSQVSFFEDLGKLKVGDTFTITFQQKKYLYQIQRIETQEKNGTISVPVTDEKQAVLTTCHPTQEGKQLVVIANFQKETGSI